MTSMQFFVFLYECCRGGRFSIYVKTDEPGVDLPKDRETPQVIVISIEPGNAQNHQNLEYKEDSMSLLLSFKRAPHSVVIPWRSIIGIASADFAVSFNQDAPRTEKPAPKGLRLVK